MHRACWKHFANYVRPETCSRAKKLFTNQTHLRVGDTTKRWIYTSNVRPQCTLLLPFGASRHSGRGIPPSTHINSRQIFWPSKSALRTAEFDCLPDNQEDAARATILDNVMKGRQPTDLMLRCKSAPWLRTTSIEVHFVRYGARL